MNLKFVRTFAAATALALLIGLIGCAKTESIPENPPAGAGKESGK